MVALSAGDESLFTAARLHSTMTWAELFERAAAAEVDEETVRETLRRHREGDDD